jgi:hypothetical protein
MHVRENAQQRPFFLLHSKYSEWEQYFFQHERSDHSLRLPDQLNLRGDSVQVPTALRRQATAAARVLLENLQPLEALDSTASHGARTDGKVGRGSSVALETTENFANGADTNGRPAK